MGQVAQTRAGHSDQRRAARRKTISTPTRDVRSELAVPTDRQEPRDRRHRYSVRTARTTSQPEHLRLLKLTASRIGGAIENARLYTRVSRQAQTLKVLNEISREFTSILDLDALLERIGQLLRRIIDFQMFSVWLVNEREQVLENRFAVRFGERFYPDRKDSRSTRPGGRRDRGAAAGACARCAQRPALSSWSIPKTRSEMAVPLIYKGKVIGVLDIEHTRAHYFNEDHERAHDHAGRADCHLD